MTWPLAVVIAVTFLAALVLDRWIVRQHRLDAQFDARFDAQLAEILNARQRPAKCAPGRCGGTWHIRLRYRHGNLYEFAVRDPLAAAHCYLIDGRLPEARA